MTLVQMKRSRSAAGRSTSLFFLFTLGLTACRSTEAGEIRTRLDYGDPVAIGEGTARAWVAYRDDVPQAVGVTLSEGALRGLPAHHDPAGIFVHGHTTFEGVLPLPAGHGTPYEHVLMNWNPGGHEPPGIYDEPHFDFHFYTISNVDRLAIDENDPQFQQKAEREPAPELIPAGYILPAPLAFPRMGVHWVDPASPELNGQRFTHTFIYGSWNGELIFAEPMLTKAFLETKQNVTVDLPQPAAWPESGYYPTGYSIEWNEDAREYRIALTGLVPRT